MKIFITGINGFVGSYLAEHLVKYYPKSKIYGLARQHSNLANIAHFKDKINLVKGNLLSYKKIASLML